jgi:hypothetical protein
MLYLILIVSMLSIGNPTKLRQQNNQEEKKLIKNLKIKTKL